MQVYSEIQERTALLSVTVSKLFEQILIALKATKVLNIFSQLLVRSVEYSALFIFRRYITIDEDVFYKSSIIWN